MTTIPLENMGARYWYATVAKSAHAVLAGYLNGDNVEREAMSLVSVLERGPWGGSRIEPDALPSGNVGSPAREYRWRNFDEPALDGSGRTHGAVVATQHGAHSPELYEPRAVEMLDAYLEAAAGGEIPPDLARPQYRSALVALCRTEARIERLDRWLTEREEADSNPDRAPGHDEKGTPFGPMSTLDRLEGRARMLRGRLGLDPWGRNRHWH